MRNTMIALTGNNAIVMAEKSYKSGQYKLLSANSSTAAALMALEFALNKASNNDTIDKEVLRIYVPDMIKGFAMGSYVDYIRTGKTSGGRQFTEEELALVKTCAKLMCDKGLNIKVTESKYMAKELKPFKDEVLKIAKELKINAPAQTAAPQAPAKSPVIVKLEELMTKALEEGDLDKFDQLEERLNRMMAKENAPVQTTTAPQENAPVEKPEVEEEEELEENEVEVDSDVMEMDC